VLTALINATLIVEPELLSTFSPKLPPPDVTLNTTPSVSPISVVELSADNAVEALAAILTVPVRWLFLSVV